jgi:hypothetical protein
MIVGCSLQDENLQNLLHTHLQLAAIIPLYALCVALTKKNHYMKNVTDSKYPKFLKPQSYSVRFSKGQVLGYFQRNFQP